MKGWWLASLAAALLVVATLTAPRALAEDLIVEHNPTDPTHFSTIQGAINHAANILKSQGNLNNSFRIMVEPDQVPYPGPITPISNVPIIGRETGRTFISGGTSPLVNINGLSTVTIRNLTFLSAATAISISGSSGISITNNVFEDISGLAVQVRNSATTQIINNTFFGNGTAIDTAENITITNNIFDGNRTAINGNGNGLSNTTYNDYFQNDADGPAASEPFSVSVHKVGVNPDPLFVAPLNRDFHLKAGSPAHSYQNANAGNPSYPNSGNANSFDMGAYGGPFRDTIPMPVTGLTSRQNESSIELTWDVNLSYEVSGYRVYFGPTQTSNGPGSPFFVQQDTTSGTISTVFGNFTPATTVPDPTTITSISPRNHALAVTWLPSANATGYRIFYSSGGGSLADAPFVSVEGGATTSAVISNLENGVRYRVAMAAVNQTEVFATVTAVNNATASSVPGVDNESAPTDQLHFVFGDAVLSGLSNEVTDAPEAVSPYPNLKNEGCFIATAAYGFYSAPQVQALRDFRDRYLLTNAPGRAFVAWYYRHGPVGARYLNAHPWLKGPVRLILLPLVVVAAFLVYTPPLMKTAVIMILVLVADFLYRRVERKPMVKAGRII